MNKNDYVEAFSALRASDDIELEKNMNNNRKNMKFHMRPALAACLCAAALLGCFSTAYAVDAGGIKTAVEKIAAGEDLSANELDNGVDLEPGKTYTFSGEDGAEYEFETAEGDDYGLHVSKSEKDDGVILNIEGSGEDSE